MKQGAQTNKPSRKSKKHTSPNSKVAKEQKIVPLLAADQMNKLALAISLIIYITYVFWGIWSHSTWDDDCHGRYFNTLMAFKEPHHFIDLWNRPLFVILFCIPVLISKYTIPIIMSAISVFGAYMLYKSAKELKLSYAFMVIPFVLFQPYFLGVGRDAMTEPLAATIISIGIYLSIKEKWVLFALIGSLLPLARTELVLLLPIWAGVLFFKKQWKIIPLLGIGLIWWNVAGWIIDGDIMYLINATVYGSPEKNRYGQQPFDTYFSRYFYIIGPTVFFFFIAGLVDRVRKLDFNPLILVQFLTGFFLYTIFAWKITLGQSAGFLRNLIPLSPLAAMIALYGFNFWMRSILLKRDKILLLATTAFSVLLTTLFFRNEIRMHHIVSTEFDYFNLPIILILMCFTVFSMVVAIQKNQKIIQLASILLVSFLLISHTLYTEPPNENMNAERYMVNHIVDFYKAMDYEKNPITFCSHLWFHWVGEYDMNKAPFKPMRLAEIKAAPYNSVIIWESHYSNRIGADVELSDLSNTNEYVQIAQFFPEDLTKTAYLFLKKDPKISEIEYLNQTIAKAPNFIEPYLNRANYYQRQNDSNKNFEDLSRASQIAPDNVRVKLALATYYLQSKDYPKTIATAAEILRINSNVVSALSLQGVAYFNQGNFTEAASCFEKLITESKGNAEASYNLGLCLINLKRTEEACQHLRVAASAKINNADQLLQQYCK